MIKDLTLALLLQLPIALLSAGSAFAAPAQSKVHAVSPADPLQLMMRQSEERIATANHRPEMTGSGPYPAQMEIDLALPDATIYRPAKLGALGAKKLGLVIWGNGGCSNDGASARAHLAEIASHGYLVIAAGQALTGPLVTPGGVAPTPMTTNIGDMRAALDWALAENARKGSPYYRQIDPALVATSGHSCGGMLAIILGEDPRIKTVIIHNSGIFPVLPANPPLLMHRERIQGLHTPVLFVMGGKSDVAMTFGEQAFADIHKLPAFFGSLEVGHGGTFNQPNGGRAAEVAVDWLEWHLRGDSSAAKNFTGPDCSLCNNPEWSIRKKGIR